MRHGKNPRIAKNNQLGKLKKIHIDETKKTLKNRLKTRKINGEQGRKWGEMRCN